MTEATISLNDSNVYFDFENVDDLNKINISTNGDNHLHLFDIDETDLEEIVVTDGHGTGNTGEKYGTGDGLRLAIGESESCCDLTDIDLVKTNGFDGNVALGFFGALGENATIQTGIGDDNVYIEKNMENGSTIMTGRGDDYINVDGSIGDNATIRTGSLPGADTIQVGGNVGSHFTAFTEEGRDTLIDRLQHQGRSAGGSG